MPGSAMRVNIDGMPEAAAQPVDTPRPPRKLYRSSDGRWLGGVARGLAGHLGLPVTWVRLVFAGLFLADGLGALVYAAFWFVVPLGVGGVDNQRPPAIATETSPDGWGGWRATVHGGPHGEPVRSLVAAATVTADLL